MAKIHGLVYIIIGFFVFIVSLTSKKFIVFLFVGIIFILVGVIKFILKVNGGKVARHVKHETYHHKYCTQCGNLLRLHDKFCTRCGARF